MGNNRKKYFMGKSMLIHPKLSGYYSVYYISLKKCFLFRSFFREFYFTTDMADTIGKILGLLDGNHAISQIVKKYRIDRQEVNRVISFLDNNALLESTLSQNSLIANFRKNMTGFRNGIKKGQTLRHDNYGLFVMDKEFLRYMNNLCSPKELMRLNLPTIRHLESGSPLPAISLCLSGVLDHSFSDRINEIYFGKRRKYSFCFIDQEHMASYIGNIIPSKSGGCLECFKTRYREGGICLPYELIIKRKSGIPSSISQQMHEISFFTLKNRLIRDNIAKNNDVCAVLDFRKSTISEVALIRKESCSICSEGIIPTSTRISNPPVQSVIRLKNRKIVMKENGFRTVPVKKTLKLLKRLTGGRISIINESASFPVLKNKKGGLNIVRTISADPMGNNINRLHWGKGITEEQNYASAMMEALERYCSKMDGSEKVIRGTYGMLRKTAINPREFILPDNTRFDDTTEINWSWGYSLTENKSVLVPCDYFFFQRREASRQDPKLIPMESNGLSSGNTIEEAVLQGILEVIERDAKVIMELNRLNMPDILFPDPVNKQVGSLFQLLDRLGLEFNFKYISSDIPVPVINIFIRGKVGGKEAFSTAAGAHLDPVIAITRAVTESLQMFPQFKDKSLWLRTHPTDHLCSKSEKTIKFQDVPDMSEKKDIKNNIRICLDMLKKMRCKVIVCNMTKRHIGFPVVRILVSGLQPVYCHKCFIDYPRHSQRLFEVPMVLGYRKNPASLKDLSYGFLSGVTHILQ